MTDRILILDFGSQVTQLIARRVREAGVYCEILPFNADPKRIADFKKGIKFYEKIGGQTIAEGYDIPDMAYGWPLARLYHLAAEARPR